MEIAYSGWRQWRRSGKLHLIILFLTLSFYLHAQTAHEIIGKYVAFIGGKQHWKNVTTIISSGEYNYGGVVFPFKAYNKAPDRYKFIVTYNGKYYEQAFDGTSGWKIDVFNGEKDPTVLTGNPARAMSNEANVELEDVFIDYKKKGHKATLEGKDTVQGQLCQVIKLVLKNGESETYYFNLRTSEIMMKKTVSRNSEMKGETIDIFYSDYRDVNKIKMPFKAVVKTKDQTLLTININAAELNTAIPETTFQFQPKGNL